MSQALYRYCGVNLNSLAALNENFVFLSNPEGFNDPFDSLLNQMLAGEFYGTCVSWELADKIRTLRSRLGVCCFSSEYDNLHLWSHYAEGHAGICIEYNASIIESYLLEKTMAMMPKRVNYIDSPLAYGHRGFLGYDENGQRTTYHVPLNGWQAIWDGKFIDKAVENLILQKNSVIWGIEKEFRMIAHPLALQVGLDKGIISKVGSVGFKLKLPDNAVSKVYFGWQSKLQNIRLVSSIVHPNVSLLRMSPTKIGWKLKDNPYKEEL